MRRVLFSALPLAVLALAACSNPELEKRIADLETKVTTLEGKVGKAPAGAPQVDPAREEAASGIFKEINEATEAGNYDLARQKLGDLKKEYGDTRVAKRAPRIEKELNIIGTDPGPLEVDKWFQGKTSFNDGKATLVVFWEVWCPHCQEELPKLEGTYEKYKGQGLNIVAVTKVTRSSSDEKVAEFIKEHKLEFPVGKEKGDISAKFAVEGIPAAAVVKGGKIIWRGHPAKMDDAMIQGWLQG